MPSKQITTDEKDRIVERFMKYPTIDLELLAQKEGLSKSTVYKTLNQELPNWKCMKQEVCYLQTIKGIFTLQHRLERNFDEMFPSKYQAQTIIGKNQYTVRNDTKREQKLMTLVIQLQRNYTQMEGRIEYLEETLNLNRYQIPFDYEHDENYKIANYKRNEEYQNEKGNQKDQNNLPKFNKSNNLLSDAIQMDNSFTQKQDDNQSKIQQQNLQKRLRISLKQVPNAFKARGSNIDSTYQNEPIFIAEATNYQPQYVTNNQIENLNEINFDLKLEDHQQQS